MEPKQPVRDAAPSVDGQPVINLQQYLTTFGYLATDDPTDKFAHSCDIGLPLAAGDTADETVATALKTFQRFYKLKETGTLTPETKRLLVMPRCGNPDKPKLFDPATGLVAFFAVQGNKWNSSNVTFSFENFTGDLASSAIITAIRQAFNSWSNVCFLTFTEITGGADIRIKFAVGDHGDGTPFDGPGNVLAHGFFPPPNGGDLAGDLHFDDAETWSLDSPTPGGRFDLWTVALHEIGHTLGLNHSNDATSVMFAFYSGIRRDLHPDDINGMAAIYGGRAAKGTRRDTSIAQPSFAAQNRLGFIAWTGTDASHRLNVMQTRELRVWFGKVTLGDTSLSAPSLTSFNGRPFLAWRGVGNNQLNVMSSADGVNWGGKVTLGDTTFNSPAICSANGKLFLAWTGTDSANKLNTLRSTNGVAFGTKSTFSETSFFAPDISSLNGQGLLLWTGKDNARSLNVMTI